jgi:hypothetical protein
MVDINASPSPCSDDALFHAQCQASNVYKATSLFRLTQPHPGGRWPGKNSRDGETPAPVVPLTELLTTNTSTTIQKNWEVGVAHFEESRQTPWSIIRSQKQTVVRSVWYMGRISHIENKFKYEVGWIDVDLKGGHEICGVGF